MISTIPAPHDSLIAEWFNSLWPHVIHFCVLLHGQSCTRHLVLPWSAIVCGQASHSTWASGLGPSSMGLWAGIFRFIHFPYTTYFSLRDATVCSRLALSTGSTIVASNSIAAICRCACPLIVRCSYGISPAISLRNCSIFSSGIGPSWLSAGLRSIHYLDFRPSLFLVLNAPRVQAFDLPQILANGCDESTRIPAKVPLYRARRYRNKTAPLDWCSVRSKYLGGIGYSRCHRLRSCCSLLYGLWTGKPRYTRQHTYSP